MPINFSLPDFQDKWKMDDGWVDDLQFYVVFNSIADVEGRCEDDNQRLYAIAPRLRLEIFPPKAGFETGTARSAGQRLTR